MRSISRRIFVLQSLGMGVSAALSRNAWALSWSDITQKDANLGLKAALSSATTQAVQQLGVENGFLGNPKVRIPLPKHLQQAQSLLNTLGMREQLEELETAMNHAAEHAVVEAKPIFISALKAMTVQDAKSIISDGNDAGTQYFKNKTSSALRSKFLPVVKRATDQVGLAQQYNALAQKGATWGMLKPEQTSVEAYVTQKALDGLFTVMAEEEQEIRANPVKAGTDIVRKVFGALGK